MLGCTVYGINNGDVKKMMAPYDKDNNFCGVSNATKNYPSLYFPQLQKDATDNIVRSIFRHAICVKKCPKKQGDPIECSAG